MRKTIVDLEAELKDAGRRIEELRGERDKAQELVERMREHINDANRMIESWIEAFEMKLADDGIYKWKASFVEGDEWYEKYSALLKKWNAAVADFNARIAPRPVGRPLAASDTQVASVLKLRKQGLSLRSIADQTSLSRNTVCPSWATKTGRCGRGANAMSGSSLTSSPTQAGSRGAGRATHCRSESMR